MPLSQELLQHSRRLVMEQREAEPPAEVELRRAISAAYYSAWHGVCDSIAAKFHEALYTKLNRQPAHTGAKIAASSLLGQNNSWQPGECSEEMSQFCRNFLNLQNLRIKADYDTTFDIQLRNAIDAFNCANRIYKFLSNESVNCKYFDSFVLQCLEVKFRARD